MERSVVPKVKKLARSLRIATNIVFWGLVVVVAMSLVVGVVATFRGEEFSWLQTVGAKRGFVLSSDSMIRYQIDEWTASRPVKPIYQTLALAGLVGAGAFAVIIKKVQALLCTIERDEPFARENAGHLQVIGYVLLAGSLGFRIIGAMIARNIIATLNLTNLHVNVSVDATMAMSGFLFLILAGVFRYGNYLQQEYDSTL